MDRADAVPPKYMNSGQQTTIYSGNSSHYGSKTVSICRLQVHLRQNQHPVCSDKYSPAMQHTCGGGGSLLCFTFIIIRLLQGRFLGLASSSCLVSFCKPSQSVNTRSLRLHSSMSSSRGLEQRKGVSCSAMGTCLGVEEGTWKQAANS